MNTQLPEPGLSESESSQLAGTSTNTSLIGIQQEWGHQLVNLDAANAATKNMTQDAHLRIVHKTGSSTNMTQHAVRCEYIRTGINGRQLTVYHAAGVCRELCDQFIATHNGKPPWSTKVFIRTVHKIKHHDVVYSGIIAAEFPDKYSRE